MFRVGPDGPGRPLLFEIDAEPEPIRARVRAGNEPVPLTALMPLARWVADQAADRATRRAALRGETVSCRSGCDACCKYLVPLSDPETRVLAGEVLSAPPPVRDLLLARFAAAARRVLDAQGDDSTPAPDDPGRWYSGLSLDCPLLHRSTCSLYSRRPLSCRQHLVSSPPALCAGHRPGVGRVVSGGPNVSHALSVLSAEAVGPGENLQAVLMPLAIAWACSDASRTAPALPAADAVQRFGEILSSRADHRAAKAGRTRDPAA